MRSSALFFCSLLIYAIVPLAHGDGDFTAFEQAPDPLATLAPESDDFGGIDWSSLAFPVVFSSSGDQATTSDVSGLDALPYAQSFTSRVEEPTILLLMLLGLVLIGLARWRR